VTGTMAATDGAGPRRTRLDPADGAPGGGAPAGGAPAAGVPAVGAASANGDGPVAQMMPSLENFMPPPVE
jgi:hypothetical protein